MHLHAKNSVINGKIQLEDHLSNWRLHNFHSINKTLEMCALKSHHFPKQFTWIRILNIIFRLNGTHKIRKWIKAHYFRMYPTCVRGTVCIWDTLFIIRWSCGNTYMYIWHVLHKINDNYIVLLIWLRAQIEFIVMAYHTELHIPINLHTKFNNFCLTFENILITHSTTRFSNILLDFTFFRSILIFLEMDAKSFHFLSLRNS